MKPYQLAIGILATAVVGMLLYLLLSPLLLQVPQEHKEEPVSQSASLPADISHEDRQPIVGQPIDDASLEAAQPAIESPWSDELVGSASKVGSLPHDSLGYPVELRPYLHRMLNQANAWGDPKKERDPTSGAYVPKLSEILQSLPEGYEGAAKQHEKALADIVHQYALAAHALEIEHWQARVHAYHLAIENGDFVVVDNTAYPMTSEGNMERANNNKRHLDQLNLGVMNQDFFYIVSSSRSNANGVGMYSALIYITKSKYPEPFLLFDEVVKLKQQAERAVRDYLGIR